MAGPTRDGPATAATATGPGVVRVTTRHGTVSTRRRQDSTRRVHARIDFAAVSAAALPHLPELLARWLPDGRRVGSEYVARNPRRDDRHAGSLSVSLCTGRWADFALADARGGDVVSLAAYLHGLSQAEAARRVARAVGVSR